MPMKRQSTSAPSGDYPPVEKKYKPLNTTPNSTKEIKVKVIPAQPMEGLGFLDALNSAPIPGIKIKKKKKVLSPTAAKASPFEGKPAPEASAAKPSSPEPATASEPMEVDRPGTPVPAVEVPELMETASSEQNSDTKPSESAADSTRLTKKGKKKKTVTWPEESKLWEYFYFELDETELVNVNKIKDFGEAAKREMLKDWHAFETARWLSHNAMKKKVPWVYPKFINLPSPLVQPGSSSREKFTQAERENGVLQEIFLSKESVPDSPHEPDPESYEPLPPKLIPLDKGGPNNHKTKELMKQPDYSDKIKHLLGNLQTQPPGPSGVPLANGFPPGPKNMQHFPPGGPGPMPDMSSRPVCRHFKLKGSCRYENNCAFYHPGVNRPPLLQHPGPPTPTPPTPRETAQHSRPRSTDFGVPAVRLGLHPPLMASVRPCNARGGKEQHPP
ncbi:Biglycan [Platysternon megacephalum]|uniref:Biglycan n=1 Tax=Platysternon megacephalum TaxID=55544 RepID=A0A4D9DMY1_9SAUR|nr:Biglycan [Platysternon megacephalum]